MTQEEFEKELSKYVEEAIAELRAFQKKCKEEFAKKQDNKSSQQ